MSVVVSDTSPIRALHHLHLLDYLGALYQEIVIPPAVAHELSDAAAAVCPIRLDEIPGARVVPAQDRARLGELLQSLDAGESEAICVALEIGTRSILIDEARGRRAAVRFGLQPVGALGILIRAKHDGRVSRIAPLLDELERGIAFRISMELRDNILRRVGE